MKAGRNSSIELLKIAGMFLIIISHSIPRYGISDGFYCLDLTTAIPGTEGFIINLFHYFGDIGNALFLCCSAYFLSSENASSQRYLRKAGNIIADTVLISWLWLLTALILSSVPARMTFHSLFPITFANNWFVTCYVMLLILVPSINRVIAQMTDKNLKICAIGLLIIYSILPMYQEGLYFSSHIVLFVSTYFITAYIKKIESKLSSKKLTTILIMGVFGFIISTFALRILCTTVTKFDHSMSKFCSYSNPFILCIAIPSVLLATRTRFNSKVINTVSSFSLLIYVLHENLLFRELYKPVIWKYGIDNGFGYIEGTIIFATLCFLVSILIAFLYTKTLKRLTSLACEKLFIKLNI